MQRGELASHEPRVVAHWLFSSVYLIHLIYGRDLEFITLPDDPDSVRAYVRLQVEILMNGLKPQTAASPCEVPKS